jgi:hypothetical protein
MTSTEKKVRERFIENRIYYLKSTYPREVVSKHVDFSNSSFLMTKRYPKRIIREENFDLILDWDKELGLALVADLGVNKLDEFLDGYKVCSPRLIGHGRKYKLDGFGIKIKDAWLRLKKDIAKHLKMKRIEKLGVKEVYSILDRADEERLEHYNLHQIDLKEIGFDPLRVLEAQNLFFYPELNYLVEYDPKREIALVANCQVEMHKDCWIELGFADAALIGKTWCNFLPPAYANKSIDEGIRWMCWLKKGDYFVAQA